VAGGEETKHRPALLRRRSCASGDVRHGLPEVDVQLIGVAAKTIGAWTVTGNLD
jgi:hypothetical protein